MGLQLGKGGLHYYRSNSKCAPEIQIDQTRLEMAPGLEMAPAGFAAGGVGGADGGPHALGHFRTLGLPHPHLDALARPCSHPKNELAHRHHLDVLAVRALSLSGAAHARPAAAG